jgi:uronate dehydrogenase
MTMPEDRPDRVLLTGAAGYVGTVLRNGLAGRYSVLRVSDIAELGEPREGEEVVSADIRKPDEVDRMMEGVDSVVHLGAFPVENTWENILETNIAGTYNVFDAARQHGVKRIVFASSNHAIGFYRRGRRIDSSVPQRPDSRYGLSKAFGEDLGSLYADKHGFGFMAIRIGSCLERPPNERMLSTWISHRDMVHLTQVGLETPELHFAIVYGISDNKRGWWDNSVAFELGYRPQDDSEIYAEEILAMDPPEDADEIALQFQGGVFTSAEFDGDISKL